MKTKVQKRLDYIFKFYQTLHTQIGEELGGLMYSVKESTNMHKLNKRRSDFQYGLFLILHFGFADATQVLLCKSN